MSFLIGAQFCAFRRQSRGACKVFVICCPACAELASYDRTALVHIKTLTEIALSGPVAADPLHPLGVPRMLSKQFCAM